MKFTEHELTALVAARLKKSGADDVAAQAVAMMLVAAQRDGVLAHDLRRLPAYVDALRTKQVDGAAVMSITHCAPGVLYVDAANGFAQAALARVKESAMEKTRANGICAVNIRDAHHLGVLWFDVEQFAHAGLVCLACANCRSLMVAPGAHKKVLGTNPLAFAVPRHNAPPLVIDQASSVMSYVDVMSAAQQGLAVADAVGVDRDGGVTRDARAIVEGGALLPFGGHKGFWIALMVEVLAAALTGSRCGFEHGQTQPNGSETSKAGQMLILIDPAQTGATDFRARIDVLLQRILRAGTERLPGDRRYHARVIAQREGIAVENSVLEFLRNS